MDTLWLNIIVVAISFDLMQIGNYWEIASAGWDKRRIVATVKLIWLGSAPPIAGWPIFAWALVDRFRKVAPALA